MYVGEMATVAGGTHPTGMHTCYRPQTKFAKVMFLQVPVCPKCGGGGYPNMHCRWYPSMPCSRGIFRPTSRGKVEDSGQEGFSRPTPGGLQAHTWGVSRPTSKGGVSRPTPGGVFQHVLRWTPPLWTVHILLECILVVVAFAFCPKILGR